MPESRPPAAKSSRRAALGADPLSVLDAPPVSPVPAVPEPVAPPSVPATASPARGIPEFDKLTARLPGELLAEIRAACVALAGPPERLNMTAFAERAFRVELARLRDQYNDGAPFPLLGEKLRGGRPVGS